MAFTAMESDHMLCYDGVQSLPKALYEKSPSYFGDDVSHALKYETVAASTIAYLALHGLTPNNLIVRDIDYDATDTNTPFTLGVSSGSTRKELKLAAVIFTPHVRQLQMMSTTAEGAAKTRKLLSEPMWEAIEYTHCMQSAKTFVSAKEAFWKKKRPDGKFAMSTTLSDRLTRGTYLLDYLVDEAKDIHGAAVCLTYTWNDDALKFLPFEAKDRAARALAVLKDVYPDIAFDSMINSDPTTISWENDPMYLGAFKNNLPGHYRYQRRLYSQFAEPETPAQSRFVLAGDDVSWTGGWAEGAITTGLNAAHAIVKALGGRAFNDRGPLDRWKDLKPKVL